MRFVTKQNKNNEIVQYKTLLIAQSFSKRPDIDYEETYSPAIDVITFKILISLAVSETLDIHLMDVVVTYLYGSLDKDIHMKIHERFAMPETFCNEPRSV